MTSEGHHAGQPPAKATSGGPAEPFGDDGFPPDSDSQARASGFPTSYAPPPQSTPNGGSPFVVPTVFGQPGSPQSGPPQPESPPSGSPWSGSPQPESLPSGSPWSGSPQPGSPQAGQAQLPDPADRTTPPAFPPPAAGSARVPGLGDGAGLPQRTSGLPQRTAPGSAAGPFSANPPSSGSPGSSLFGSGDGTPPPSAWAPPPAAGSPAASASDPFGQPAEPHPYRADDDGSSQGFTGFAPGSPTRGRAGLDDDQPSSRFDRPGSLASFDRPESLGDRPASGSPYDRPGLDASADRPGSGSPFAQPGSGVDRPSSGSPFDQAGSAFDQPGSAFDQRGSSFDQPQSFDQAGSSFDRPSFDQRGSAFDQHGSPAPQFGTAGPGPEQPSAPLGRPGSLPERSPSDDSGSDRTPGLSAFGDQRVRVPGATLTGLPDAPPSAAGGLPEAPTSDRGGLPTRMPAGGQEGFDSGQLPQRTGGGLPRRGQPVTPDEPIFGTPRGDDSVPDFRPASGSPYGGPEASRASAAVPPPGPSPFGGDPSDEHQYGRPPAGESVFGRPGGDSPYGPPAGESVFGRSSSNGSPFGRADDEPANPYGGEGDNGSASPFGPPASGGPIFGSPAGAQTSPGPADRSMSPGDDGTSSGASPFGGFVPGGGPGPAGFDGTPDRPDGRPSTSLFGGFVPRGSSAGAPGFGGGTDDGDPGTAGGGFGPRPDSSRPDSAWPESPRPDFAGSDFAGSDSGGFAQRVPGASFAASGMPVAAEPRNGSVPQPRDPADRGSARAVSASASVPTTNRVAPSDADEVPPPVAAPQARVYGRPAQPSDDDPGRPEPAEPAYPSSGGPAVPPPGRVSGRATASARVAPPGSDPTAAPPPGPPFTEPTTDVARRGQRDVQPGAPLPADRYSENTTDISHRGPGSDQPYVPAPALSPMYGRPPLENGFPPAPEDSQDLDRPRMGGVFPGPATRATVTPPSPDQTSSWPGVEAQGPPDTEMARFDQFRPDAEAPIAKPETPHVRLLPVLISVVVGAALLVGLAFGIVWLISRGSSPDAGISVAAGDCVKRSGDEAIKAVCGDPDTFQVVSIADTKEQCTDPGQPYVLNPTRDGKTQVLCLKPAS